MSTLTGLGLLLLATFTPTQPAGAAGKLSIPTLNARLAARPMGADAQALAEEIHAWFGKDRAGRDNVTSGANPKVEGLETAWAIEAPGAKTAAVVTGRRQEPAADPDRRHAHLRRHAPVRPRVGLPLVVRRRRHPSPAARDSSKSTPTSPSSPRSPASPRAS